jgi:outer membrane protein assembly factor BamA
VNIKGRLRAEHIKYEKNLKPVLHFDLRGLILIFKACIIIILTFLSHENNVFAQKTLEKLSGIDTTFYDSLKIDRIFIVGNKKTKPRIILRELDFAEDDIISTHNILPRIKRNEDNIFNTRLFISVNISFILIEDYKVDVIIRVAERWYFFPIPVFELADRNFHDWWVNQNHDLSRIELGLKLYVYNMRGRNETLKLTGQFGFTKRFQVAYAFPYVDKKQKIGLNFLFDYTLNKNTNYRTTEHIYRFLDSDRWLKEQYLGGVSMTYRKSLYNFHTLGVNYSQSQVNDTIVDLNPNYFQNGSSQAYFRLYYSFIYDNRDIKAYPLTGSYFSGRIEKIGLGIVDNVNVVGISVLYNRFFDLGKKFYFTFGVGGSAYGPEKQPYDLFNSMGKFPFSLRGYELYVIEGPYFIQNQYTFRKRLFQVEKDLRSILSIKQFSRFQMAVYLKSYFDLGYIKGYPDNELNTRFTNSLIYGGGAGLDLVTFYDIVLRFDYSFNKAGEHGFVFGVRSLF